MRRTAVLLFSAFVLVACAAVPRDGTENVSVYVPTVARDNVLRDDVPSRCRTVEGRYEGYRLFCEGAGKRGRACPAGERDQQLQLAVAAESFCRSALETAANRQKLDGWIADQQKIGRR
jgi:hypothetical protein